MTMMLMQEENVEKVRFFRVLAAYLLQAQFPNPEGLHGIEQDTMGKWMDLIAQREQQLTTPTV